MVASLRSQLCPTVDILLNWAYLAFKLCQNQFITIILRRWTEFVYASLCVFVVVMVATPIWKFGLFLFLITWICVFVPKY